MLLWKPHSTPQVDTLLGRVLAPRTDSLVGRRCGSEECSPTELVAQASRELVAAVLPRVRHVACALGFLVHKTENA